MNSPWSSPGEVQENCLACHPRGGPKTTWTSLSAFAEPASGERKRSTDAGSGRKGAPCGEGRAHPANTRPGPLCSDQSWGLHRVMDNMTEGAPASHRMSPACPPPGGPQAARLSFGQLRRRSRPGSTAVSPLPPPTDRQAPPLSPTCSLGSLQKQLGPENPRGWRRGAQARAEGRPGAECHKCQALC